MTTERNLLVREIAVEEHERQQVRLELRSERRRECHEHAGQGLRTPSLGMPGRDVADVLRRVIDQRVTTTIRDTPGFLEHHSHAMHLVGCKGLFEHTEELFPLVYTPTVGQACREFAHIFRQSRGLYITPDDRGAVRALLDNWPERDVRVIVVTDGERILGLGDLGSNGIGIPIGKLSLYTAFAGIDPSQCLPVQLDVGTNNRALRAGPLYLSWNHERIVGEDYDALVDEFVKAVQDAVPKALIQFEDFLTPNAYNLLGRYQNEVLCFNDDIQGTAAVPLAGVYASTRITGARFDENCILSGFTRA